MLLSDSEDLKNYTLDSQYTILVDDPSYISTLENSINASGSSANVKFFELANLLQHSIVFINNDYATINRIYNMIENEGVRFRLLDFLYYSTVTITTTGYGDILPNSSLIRTVVMFESFFGVGIPGLFISLLFLKIEHKEKKPI